MLKAILRAKTKPWHLLIRVIMFASVALIIEGVIIPVAVWLFITGDMGYPDGWEELVKFFWIISAPIILLPITYSMMKNNFQDAQLSAAKSYLFASLAVIAAMLFGWYVLAFEN